MKHLSYLLILISIISTIGCSKPIARKPVSVKSGLYISESVTYNKKIQARDEALIKKLIKNDTANTYLNSGNGFWYYFTKKDSISSLPKAKFGDLINFDYNLKKINGTLLYSKKELGNRSYKMDQEELLYGLREGLKLLQAGESAVFLIPSHLAYGYYGDTKKIGSNTPIISEVNVNSIIKIE